jgi:hypothetical protein
MKASKDEEAEDDSDSAKSINQKFIREKYRITEKYLRVSDFISFIMENKGLYSST